MLRRWRSEEFALHLARRRPAAIPEEAERAAASVVEAVRVRGDAALREFTRRFDGVELGPGELEVPRGRWEAAYDRLPEEVRRAILTAARRLEEFHRRQVPRGFAWEDGAGNRLEWLVRPLRRVGVYVPGGRAAYPSTVLMAAVPARLAGVESIVLCTPPGEGGEVPDAVLAAALVAGVGRVFRVGGAQAVAAMAHGTETVPAVDKIVGPGNAYVTAAKRLVFGVVGIDGLHGPSEVAVVADETADPELVAADLLAQSEHDPLAAAVLLTPAARLADEVDRRLEAMVAASPRGEVAGRALAGQGGVVLTQDVAQAVGLADLMAPEHLQIMTASPREWLPRVGRAGAVFLGPWAPVPAGDYAAGTNHVLPTGGTGRFLSGLSVNDFVRTMSCLESGAEGVAAWGPPSAALAAVEGLPGHARSVSLRLERAAGGGGRQGGRRGEAARHGEG